MASFRSITLAAALLTAFAAFAQTAAEHAAHHRLAAVPEHARQHGARREQSRRREETAAAHPKGATKKSLHCRPRA